MPIKKKEDEYSKIEPYKKFETYKELEISDDEINRSIQYLYKNNVWKLKDNLEKFADYPGRHQRLHSSSLPKEAAFLMSLSSTDAAGRPVVTSMGIVLSLTLNG